MKRWFFACFLSAVAALCVAQARAAELVMFERAGCVWCERWNAEVGGVYDKTDEGRKAALRRVDLAGGVPPDLSAVGAIVFTPTFVLVDKGREIGRIEGYTDEAFFYAYLNGLIAKLGAAATH